MDNLDAFKREMQQAAIERYAMGTKPSMDQLGRQDGIDEMVRLRQELEWLRRQQGMKQDTIREEYEKMLGMKEVRKAKPKETLQDIIDKEVKKIKESS